MEFYLRLRHSDEVEVFEEHLPSSCSILELGCGTGRLTRRLLDSGHRITAVDNSAEMLSHVPQEANKVLSDIEELDLRERFDVVLLASCLINTPDDSVRTAQLAACRQHLSKGGRLIFERFDPQWLRDVEVGRGHPIGQIGFSVERVIRHGSIVELSLRYTIGGEDWRQHFPARILDDDDTQRMLGEARFGPVEWIDRRWASVRAL